MKVAIIVLYWDQVLTIFYIRLTEDRKKSEKTF